ncbi:MAG: glutamyl-tRNA reductase [Parachlamydiaceae bacterium]|nr:glutamyl-tRNA reductase [Parachlamydiaceae bacterium]
MRVGILGINHRLANLKLRESLAQCCQRRFGAGHSTHGRSHFFVLLSTCNRTEIYFSSDNLAETHTYILNILRQEVEDEFDQKLYSYFGSDCFLHLCRVATGLDSAIVGETEILGQVKSAYEEASKYISLPEQLHYLFQKSLKVGKHVRSELPMQRGLPDIEHAVLNAGVQIFSDVQKAKVLFVGASDINRKIISFLISKNLTRLTLCNRSPQVATDLAALYGIETLDWDNITEWHCYDWIIFGTKASRYIVEGYAVKGNADCKLVIDLSVPRNVNPEIAKLNGVTLLNIDEINQTLSARRQQMSDVINKAEELINSCTMRQVGLKIQSENRRIHMAVEHCEARG